MKKYSNGTKRLSVQALFAYVPINDVPNAMVRRTDARNVLGIFAMQGVQNSPYVYVILPSGTKGGAVVPPCDFQYSNTISPVFIEVSLCFPSRAAPARAHTHSRACIIAAEQACCNCITWGLCAQLKYPTDN